MFVIGVTGGFGTGKSTVCAMFRDLGAVVLDADAIAHELMQPKRLAWRRIIAAFGKGILNEDQTISRQRLGAVVFANAAARKRLEMILHPQVLKRITQDLHRLRRRHRLSAVVLDVPLLVEAGAQDLADALVVVTAPAEVQRQRLRRKYGASADVDARIIAQWDLSAKVALADHVVDNSDGVEATRTQVKKLWEQLVPCRTT